MKSYGIRRSIRANRYDRAAGDAPSLGRVSKMPGAYQPKGGELRRRRRSGDGYSDPHDGRARSAGTMRLTYLFSGLVVILLGFVSLIWLLPKMKFDEEVGAPVAGGNAVAEPGVAPKFPSPSEREAISLVKQALLVRDPAEVEVYFRHGASPPSEVIDFLKNLEAVDGKLDGFQWLSSMDVNRLAVDGVSVNFTKDGVPRNRLALLTPDETGRWVIDFDAFARTVMPTWSELLDKKAEVARVRVHIAKDSYYNGRFSDETQWLSYGMASPDTEGILLGYCKVASPQAAAMEWIFSKKDGMNRVTLEIRRVDGAEPRQFEISRVLAEDWILGERAFDEGF